MKIQAKRKGIYSTKVTASRSKKIRDMYLAGYSGKVIAKMTGFIEDLVYGEIRKAGIGRGIKGAMSPQRKQSLKKRNDEIAERYKAGISLKELAAKHRKAENTIRTILKGKGIRLRHAVYEKKGSPPHHIHRNRSIDVLFLEGKTVSQTAAILGISIDIVRNVLRKSLVASETIRTRSLEWQPVAKLNRNKKIAEGYRLGKSLTQLSDQFGLSPERIRKIIKESGMKLKPYVYRKTGYRPQFLERNLQIIDLYKAGNTPTQIAEKLKITLGIVSNIVNKEGLARKLKKLPTKKHREMKKRDESIGDYYKSGFDVKEITKKFDLSAVNIRRILFEQKIPLRPRIYRNTKPPDEKMIRRNSKMVALFLKGASVKKLMEMFHLSLSQVKSILKNH